MANYKIMKQEVEDYDKAMGAYSDVVDAYNDKVNAYNAKPYITYHVEGSADYGKVGLSNGAKATMFGAAKNGVPAVGTRVDLEPASFGYIGRVAASPGPAPSEPSVNAPSFTRSQANTLQSPPPSLSESSLNTPSKLDKIKEQEGMRPASFLNPNGEGILQRVRAGKL